MNYTTAETVYGPVQGRQKENGVHVFKGIPYGQNTGGARRFLPAVPPRPWDKPLEALGWGPACPQGTFMLRDNIDKSEDCLRLNIWTQGINDGGGRPVMVWLHGGGFVGGSSAGPMTDGTNLALSGDVVVVSLNHRLNVFGFLYLKELWGDSFEASGNAGMLDIVRALEWIRDNIKFFGGNPQNVTIFGESGGGRKVSILMGMPSTRGLFHRAIIQSGAHPRGVPVTLARNFAAGLLEWLDISPAEPDKLQEMPAQDLFSKTASYVSRCDSADLPASQSGRWMVLSPVLDGVCLPANPFDPASPLSRDVPLIIGTNKDEMALFYSMEKNAGQTSEKELMERLRPVFGNRTEEVVATHRRNRPHETAWDLLVSISSEDRRLLSIETAEQKFLAGGAPVYLYLFTWESDFGLLKAAHGMEIPFVFNNPDSNPMVGKRADRYELARQMSQTWIAFARNGDPNHDGLPVWKRFDTGKRATMLFDVPSSLEYDPRREERLAWEGIKTPLPWEGEAFVGSYRRE